MPTSCFFCQTLLSDYGEGILPSGRHKQLQTHLSECADCRTNHEELTQTLQFLNEINLHEMGHELEFRVLEAAQTGKSTAISRRKVSVTAFLVLVPIFSILAVAFILPDTFPRLAALFRQNEATQFVRYYPLLQGASEILEEQGTWLHLPEGMGSLWEEGGLSPEEFEKSFQLNRSK